MRKSLAGAAALVLAAGLSSAVGGPSAGAAAPASQAAPGAAADPAPDPVVAQAQPAPPTTDGSVRITLVTGDRVTYADHGGVRPDVSVDLAPDSGTRSVSMEVRPDGVFVLPDTARPLIEAGRLDERLFDVRYLAENGYGDAELATVPLIVTYAGGGSPAERSAGLPATSDVTALPSIGGAGVDVAKDEATDFWRTIADTGSRRSAAVEKVWLDPRVTASLDDSRRQIGVPQAWESGHDGTGTTVAVLDTGYDTGHPDLADQVVGSQSFIEGETVQDGHGHGTHVASTVAGSGKASDGRYAGVAPGADLLIGKVLSDSGSSFGSEVIDGMEWAVDQDADVVNMSLGSFPSDGTDPQSQALNRLSEESGTLFVVAAGNFGAPQSVTTPAAADAALAVAAVDARDRVTGFSSRGPRVRDNALKPEISAPGASIVAARAAGTHGGVLIGEHYVAADGTSMASPHVAGVAAMVRQRHPDWTAQQVKDALMSTSVDIEEDLFAQGAGRVDAAAVTSSTLTATGKAELGTHPQGATEPQTRTVTYTNSGDADVSLRLELDVTDVSGDQARPAALALSQRALTVPAGGTASVDLTLDPAASAGGRFGGHLRASSGEETVATAVVYEVAAATHRLEVALTGRDGTSARGNVTVVDESDPRRYHHTHSADDSGRVVLDVPAGTYSVYGAVATQDPGGQFVELGNDVFLESGVRVEGATTVAVSAEEAVDHVFRVRGARGPTEPTQLTTSLYRTSGNGMTTGYVHLVDRSQSTTRHGAIPSDRPATGGFRMSTVTTLREPLVTAAVGARRVPVVTPRYSGRFDGRRTAPLVDVGAGTEDDFAAADVDGAVALVAGDPSWADEQAQRARQHGALALLVTRDRPGPVQAGVGSENTLPVLATSFGEGEWLRSRLAAGPVRLTLDGVIESAYTYQLWSEDRDRIPASLVHTTDHSQLATVENSYHAEVRRQRGSEVMEVFSTWEGGTLRYFDQLMQPARRLDYVSAGPQLRQFHQVQSLWSFNSVNLRGGVQAYRPGRRYPVAWHEAPNHPTAHTLLPCSMCRSENVLVFAPWTRGDSSPDHYGSGRTSTRSRLYRDGTPVDDPAHYLVERAATYRIVQEGEAEVAPEHRLAARSHTSWTFRSAAPRRMEVRGCDELIPSANVCAALPLIMLGYDVPLDLLNRAPSGREFAFTVRTSRAKGYAGPVGITGARVRVSYDDGRTWHRASVGRPRGGDVTVRVRHPRRAATNSFVTLRVEAWDARGNRTAQTIERAYALR